MQMLKKLLDKGVKLTPMMEQYVGIKKQYPDTLLFFRMGDFYELFFDDAIEAARLLNITQTHRGKLGETPIPMAGIPYHAAANYIDRITAQGKKVAICEQVEDPSKTQKIVRRAVTQVVSPGMPFDLEKFDQADPHYIATAYHYKDVFYLGLIDFANGHFFGERFKAEEEFLNKLHLYHPKEFITYIGQWEDFPNIQSLLSKSDILRTNLSQEMFELKHNHLYLNKLVPGYKRDKILQAEKAILNALGALAYYICSTQSLTEFKHIKAFKLISDQNKMRVSAYSLRGLEILPKSHQDYRSSLQGFFDRTKTSMGSRRLKQIFTSPLRQLESLEARYDFIQQLFQQPDALETLRETLSQVRDLNRIMAKVTTGKTTPSDLINLAMGIRMYAKIGQEIDLKQNTVLKPVTVNAYQKLEQLASQIEQSLNPEIGASLDKGNLIQTGFSKQRDKLAKLSQNSTQGLNELEEKYRNKTGIAKLKIKHNNIFGFFIEVSKAHSENLPKGFERRQTLVNSERFITKELSQFEKEVLAAREKLQQLERELFNQIVESVKSHNQPILQLTDCLACIDCFQALAWVSLQEKLVRPQIDPQKKLFQVKGAWHPLIKSNLGEEFVPHDLNLHSKKFFGLITGPNMAGKTTTMREVAIVQFLAQIGCFVPASKASLGLCDYLFSRLGASDDILRGQSTFMVEMSETAEILRHATEKSLIILDEVGRGTSTFDGLSIAWALVEHLCQEVRCLTLFATHYHELIDVVEKLEGAQNFTVLTENKDGKVRFLYSLVEGGASESFGIYVAELAGIPDKVLERSRSLLENLEAEERPAHPFIEEANQLGEYQLCFLPGEPKPASSKTPKHLAKIETSLKELDLFKLTPLQAMQQLQDLKDQLLYH